MVGLSASDLTPEHAIIKSPLDSRTSGRADVWIEVEAKRIGWVWVPAKGQVFFKCEGEIGYASEGEIAILIGRNAEPLVASNNPVIDGICIQHIFKSFPGKATSGDVGCPNYFKTGQGWGNAKCIDCDNEEGPELHGSSVFEPGEC